MLIPGGLVVLDQERRVKSCITCLTTGVGDPTQITLDPEQHTWLNNFVSKSLAAKINILSFVETTMSEDERCEVKLTSDYDLQAPTGFLASWATSDLKASVGETLRAGGHIYFVNSLRYTSLSQRKYKKVEKKGTLSGSLFTPLVAWHIPSRRKRRAEKRSFPFWVRT